MSAARRPEGADLVRELRAIRAATGRAAASRKQALLRALDAMPIDDPEDLLGLHESALFLRAYPDSPAILRAADAALRMVPARVRRLERRDGELPDALDASGIAGTTVSCAFSLPVVHWLSSRFRRSVRVEGLEEAEDRLGEALPSVLLPAEGEALADGYVRPREWLKRTAAGADSASPPRVASLFDGTESPERAALWAAMDLTVSWDLGDGPGSRSLARSPEGKAAFRSQARRRTRPDLLEELRKGGYPVTRATRAEARRWIDTAMAAVTARFREMHTFAHASERDVWVAEAGSGVRIALFGVHPEARHALRAFYGYLIARNGVPVGYGDAVMLFDWGELNFHVFETFRQADSARLYATMVRLLRHRFGIRYLHLNPYQFGRRNDEAIRTGAFWFYEKLGFRPLDPSLVRAWRAERKRLALDPAYRTSRATLRRLATAPMGLALDAPAGALMRRYRGFHPVNLALEVSRRIESRHGGDRLAASGAFLDRVLEVLGVSWTLEELRALGRIAPFLDLVPDLESWSAARRRSLAAVIRAKAGENELDYLRGTQDHRALRDALTMPLGRAPRS